jgi:putative transposase
MLSDEELETLFDTNKTPDQGRKRIHWIRQNAPVRRVSGGTKSVKVRYVPRKMPFVLEAEAFITEYAALVTYDNDDETLEIYSQPAQLKISYINSKGKKVSPLITPDLFLIGNTGFRFEECKTEEELLKLARAEPTRYRVDESGRWRSPPAETAAAELGCGFSIRSTKENNWALIDNLDFLRDYLTDRCPAVPDSEKESVLGYFKASA